MVWPFDWKEREMRHQVKRDRIRSNAITPDMQQAIDAAVYACEKRGLRATSMDMRDALEAARPFLARKERR